METLTVTLPPAEAAALVRWRLGCGHDRFFDPRDSADPTMTEAEGVILLQSVRPLPRAGFLGCSIMINNLTGPTRVSFAAANDDPWAQVGDQERLRTRLVETFAGSIVAEAEPTLAELIALSDAVLPPEARSSAPRVPSYVVPLVRLRGPVDPPPPPATPLHERLAVTLGLVNAVPTAPPDHVFEPTVELARLIANDIRTADDLPDLAATGPGPITQIEALSETQLLMLWPLDPELEPYGAWTPPE
ncbi:MAG: hypothetical protein LBR33_04490 [Propionibacteriaceae bacterium]|nr:hypothetical protein [Propionibacteriaceae bacterium]